MSEEDEHNRKAVNETRTMSSKSTTSNLGDAEEDFGLENVLEAIDDYNKYVSKRHENLSETEDSGSEFDDGSLTTTNGRSISDQDIIDPDDPWEPPEKVTRKRYRSGQQKASSSATTCPFPPAPKNCSEKKRIHSVVSVDEPEDTKQLVNILPNKFSLHSHSDSPKQAHPSSQMSSASKSVNLVQSVSSMQDDWVVGLRREFQGNRKTIFMDHFKESYRRKLSSDLQNGFYYWALRSQHGDLPSQYKYWMTFARIEALEHPVRRKYSDEEFSLIMTGAGLSCLLELTELEDKEIEIGNCLTTSRNKNLELLEKKMKLLEAYRTLETKTELDSRTLDEGCDFGNKTLLEKFMAPYFKLSSSDSLQLVQSSEFVKNRHGDAFLHEKKQKWTSKDLETLKQIIHDVVQEKEPSASAAPKAIDWEKVSGRMVTETGKERNELDCCLVWNHVVNPTINNKRWTVSDTKKLVEFVKAKRPWEDIAEELSRTPYQCFFRFHNSSSSPAQNEVMKWDRAKDRNLLETLRKNGPKWNLAVEGTMDHRATKQQVQERWISLAKRSRNPLIISSDEEEEAEQIPDPCRILIDSKQKVRPIQIQECGMYKLEDILPYLKVLVVEFRKASSLAAASKYLEKPTNFQRFLTSVSALLDEAIDPELMLGQGVPAELYVSAEQPEGRVLRAQCIPNELKLTPTFVKYLEHVYKDWWLPTAASDQRKETEVASTSQQIRKGGESTTKDDTKKAKNTDQKFTANDPDSSNASSKNGSIEDDVKESQEQLGNGAMKQESEVYAITGHVLAGSGIDTMRMPAPVLPPTSAPLTTAGPHGITENVHVVVKKEIEMELDDSDYDELPAKVLANLNLVPDVAE